MNFSKQNIIIAVVAVLAAAGAAAWYFLGGVGAPYAEVPRAEGGLGAQIFEQAQNPLKNDVPETNPFAADTNPFDAKTNPYKDTYKNPF